MSCAERRPARFPLAIRADRTPDAPALLFHSGSVSPDSMTFRELDQRTCSIAKSLREHGVAGGERVGLLLPPGPAYPVLLLSLLRAGAVAVPISTRLPGSEVPGLLGHIGCRRLISDCVGHPNSIAGMHLLDAAHLFAAHEQPRCERAPPGSAPEVEPGSARAGTPLPPFNLAADATIVFTSGSTAAPKAALHTFANHWSSAAGANRNIPLRPGDRWLLSLPPWHVGGLAVVFRCLLGGAAIAVKGGNEPLADALREFGATHVSLVATQLYRLLREERGRAALRGLKAVLLGGGPTPPTLIDEALQVGVRLVSSYGSTEMSSQATASRPGDPPEALTTAGRPLLFRQLAFTADDEILVRGRTLFRGYVDVAGVRSGRDEAGWFPTGDLGRLDDAGRLIVIGRRDTLFISGGENIHPEEIERELLRFPGLLEAVVVPGPDPEFGARPVAFLRTVDDQVPDTVALGRFLRMTLPGFKVPARYLAWPAIDEGIKPDRRALAAIAAGQHPR